MAPESRKSSNGAPKLLHIGCFDRVFPNWTNVDISPNVFVSRIPLAAWLLYKAGGISEERYRQHREGRFRAVKYADFTRRLPFADATFDCAYTSHVLQALTPAGTRRGLREVHRVLRPGGLFRIAQPDLDAIIRSYQPAQADQFLEAFFESNQKAEKNRRHWHYNETSLRNRLLEAGFRNIVRREFRQGKCVEVETVDERPGSLFMEAEK